MRKARLIFWRNAATLLIDSRSTGIIGRFLVNDPAKYCRKIPLNENDVIKIIENM